MRWLTWLATLVSVVAVVGVALLVAGRVTESFDVVVVLSGSMEPALRPGDAVVLVGRDPDTVTRGDVLAFRAPTRVDGASGSTLTLHRVVELEQTDDGRGVARTQGDANAAVDRWRVPLDGSAELAHVTRRLPYVGHVLLFAQAPWGRVALYAFAVVLLLGPAIAWFRRAWRGGGDARGEHVPVGQPRGSEDDAADAPTPVVDERDPGAGETTDRRLFTARSPGGL